MVKALLSMRNVELEDRFQSYKDRIYVLDSIVLIYIYASLPKNNYNIDTNRVQLLVMECDYDSKDIL